MGNKHWEGRITDELVKRDKVRLTARLDSLISANTAKGNPANGFLLGGEFHSNLPTVSRNSVPKKIIHPDLYDEGVSYMRDVKRTNQGITQFSCSLSQLLRDCHTDQDVRDAIPDTVVSIFPELSILTRLREPGWPFRGKALQLQNYHILEELMNFYVANRLLY